MSSSGLIFISYRRSDSIAEAGRIFDRLESEFGRNRVFKDVDSIPFGVDLAEYLDQVVSQCQVVLVIIGKSWLTVTEPDGTRRLDNPDDFVRIEVESSLRRGIPVIPVLIQGVVMPRRTQLPESLQPLARRNGVEVGYDPRFRADMNRLVKGLKGRLVEAALSSASGTKTSEEKVMYVQQGRKYDLRGAQFAGGLAETVKDNQAQEQARYIEQQRRAAAEQIREHEERQQRAVIKSSKQDEDYISSERFGADYYARLRDLLVEKDWEKADQETAEKMLKVIGKRAWWKVDESDILAFPCTDLLNIDRLWMKYSNERFGFSMQKQIYIECGAKLDGKYPGDEIFWQFADRIGWKVTGYSIDYPSDVVFATSASFGHLPVSLGLISGDVGVVCWLGTGVLFSRIETCKFNTQ